MAGKRLDLMLARKYGGDKQYYTKVGVLFENPNGSYSIKIDAGISLHSAEGSALYAMEPLPPRGDRVPAAAQPKLPVQGDEVEW